MAPGIALNVTSYGLTGLQPIYLAFVDDEGNCWEFTQSTSEVWSDPQQMVAFGGDKIISIVALPNHMIAMGQAIQAGVPFGAGSPLSVMIATYGHRSGLRRERAVRQRLRTARRGR